MGSLCDFYIGLGQSDDTLRVCDMVSENRSWDWSRISHVVPSHIILQFSTVMLPSPKAGQDCLAWKWMKRDVFSSTEI